MHYRPHDIVGAIRESPLPLLLCLPLV